MRTHILKLLAIVPALALFTVATLTAEPAFASAEKRKAKSEVTRSDESYFITMNPMVLPVMNDKGIREVVSMVVSLEVKKSDDKDEVNSLVPRLNDAYMRALYGKLDGTIYRNGQFIDVNKLKTRLIAVTNNVVGKGKVDEVLIQGINQRAYN
jgi:flagellar basal body-associated protein FliL